MSEFVFDIRKVGYSEFEVYDLNTGEIYGVFGTRRAARKWLRLAMF
jgi:hypothetical protein